MNLYMILWLNTENRAKKISQIMRVQLQHVCMLVISRVNISHLNTSLNYRSTLHYTTLNYIAQLSFISNFIPALLFSFASFLFLLSNLRHNFDSVLPACYKRLIFLWFHTTFIWIMVQWIPIQPFFSQQ